MSHYLGAVFKYLAAAAIFVFSISLSYTYFSQIAPSNMPWFTWAALGLTEIGFVCWLAVFMLQRHHDAHKTIAFVMIFVCMAAVLFTDAVELARLFGSAFFLAQFYYYGLIVLLLAHFLAFALDFFVSYFEKNPFRGNGNLIPAYHGNLIPQNGGNYSRPLALRDQPKDITNSQVLEAVSLGKVANQSALPPATMAAINKDVTLGEVLKEAGAAVRLGANTAMKKVSRSKKNGKPGDLAPGNQNVITEESTSTSSAEASELSAEQREAIREEAKARFRQLKEASEEKEGDN